MKELLALVLFSISSAVFAAAPHPYVGAGIGSSDINIADGFTNEDDKGTTWKIIGGVLMDNGLFFEGSYQDFGDFSASNAGYADHLSADIRGVTGAVGYRIPAHGPVSGYVKFGLTNWMIAADMDVELTTGQVIHGTGTKNGIDPMYGVGVMADVTPNILVRLDWERHTNVGDKTKVDFGAYGSLTASGEDMNVISVGAAYKF